MDALSSPPDGGPFGRGPSLRGAFSLLELLTVMGIVVVVMLFSLPAVSNIAGAQSLSSGTRMVSDLLSLARTEAVARNTLVRFAVARSWPDDSARAYRTMSLWYWDQHEEDFVPLSGWQTLPDGVLFESKMPGYTERASYALRDGTAVRGDYVLSNEDSVFLRHVRGRDIEMQYIEFIQTGAARLAGSKMNTSIFVITKGFRRSARTEVIEYVDGVSNRPKNWSQVNVENLSGHIRIYRP